jgi:hypothetical protein
MLIPAAGRGERGEGEGGGKQGKKREENRVP